ncbi:FUSC family protein [Phenylobacterium sp.]|jgi:multidrug resistance protein MdtO|uniref:FUSC family protein n=1 Tax=Phenylobacterium sp. TaxID=1871053 RepID=UPI002E2F072F|nr:FUSC family protein [Phenylobacterium sp.]HEX3364148.1 FUSC family protein [Phenylobacterium sp.]
MARPAADSARGFGPWLGEQLAPTPGRFAFAAKLAVICTITAAASAIYRTPDPALAAYLAFFLNARDRATSLLLELVLTLVVAIVLGIVLATAMLVLDHAAWRVGAIAVLSFVLLFLASASKLKPLAANIGMILAFGLDKLGLAQAGEEATRAILYTFLFVAMPASVSIAYNVFLGRHPRRMATSELARRLRHCAELLRTPSPALRAELARSLGDGGAEIRHWLKLAKAELGVRSADLIRLNQAVSSTLEILATVDLLASCGPAPAAIRGDLADILDEMAQILADGGYPTEVTLVLPDWADGPALGREAVAAARRAIVAFTDPAPVVAEPTPKARGGFFAADAFSNPVHMQYAGKITVAAVSCYLLYSLLDWPGIHTCFLTCYFVGLGTAAESVEKLAMRLAGAVVGATAGLFALLFVMPHVVSVGGLMIVICLGTLGAGYVAAGSPRISYVGFQMAFAFFLCTLQGPAPDFDMKTIRDRLIGIAIGNVAIYLVSTRLWPISIARRVDSALAGTLRALGAAARAPPHGSRPEEATAVYAGLEAIQTDLGLARYEPGSIRADEAWRQARRVAVEYAARLQSALLVAGEVRMAPQLSKRLESLAAGLEGRAANAAPAAAVERAPARSTSEVIEQNMHRLETTLAGQPGGASHASV